MKILVIGGTGMLGHKLVQQFKNDFEVFTSFRNDFESYRSVEIFDESRTFTNVDVENTESFSTVVRNLKPDVIINAVGIIKQLPSSKNVIKTLTVNSIFPHRLAEVAGETNSRLITISTDCVFNGKKGGYKEEDFPDAEDLYGKSKQLGEVINENFLTIRTSIIGRELETTHSLVEWFLSQKGGKIKGFKNAIYSGFPTIVLSEILADVIKNQSSLSGLYHISSEPINKFDLLCLIKDVFNLDIEIEPFEEFYLDRSLDSAKFGRETGFVPPAWTEMIEKMANDPLPYEKIRMILKSKRQNPVS